MNLSTEKELLDEAFDAYVRWQEQCVAVREAYGRWKSAPRADAPLAYAAYTTALDIEEQGSAVYASVMGRVGHLLTTDAPHGNGLTRAITRPTPTPQ
jgi:hypothetical protein